MLIINDINQLNIKTPVAVAIGKFDGVHVGHKSIISRILMLKENGYKSLIFTFNPSPQSYFTGQEEKLIMTRAEKLKCFKELGIDIVVEFPLNKVTAAISPESFIKDILVDKLNTAFIAAGDDLSYGKGGKGDFALINKLGCEYGFEAECLSKNMYGRHVISSTLIKKMLLEGEVLVAKELLGDYYSVSGKIEPGKRLGRTIGFPTINIYPEKQKMLPLYGVYYSYTTIDNVRYKSITNIGIKPTVCDENKPVAETYIYNFDADVYGREAVVALIDYKRPERKYDSVEELKAALENDIRDGKQYFRLK